jgi:hypothetical protein
MKKIIFFSLCISFLFTGRSFSQASEKKGWPSAERYAFITECIGAAKTSMSEDSARAYCYCMQFKVEAKFPTIEDAGKITAADMESPEWKKEIKSCLGSVPWDSANRADFKSECILEATKSLGEQKAKTYCECMLYKVGSKYPSMTDAAKLTEEVLKSAAWKKLIQDCVDF